MSGVAVEQAAPPQANRGAEGTDNQPHGSESRGAESRGEGRKPTTPSSNGSVSSHTTDTLTLQNCSPHRLPDIKKAEECTELPPYVSKSKNAKFHKLFKNVPLHEYPIDTYSCAFKGDILLQGVMYVSQNWICFYSKIRARGRLLEIPLHKVICITREKLALIIPNAIGVQMADHKYVFGSFMSRDNTYKLLVTLLKYSQDSANLAGRRSLLSSPTLHPEHVTHSADVSAESDTTEDDDNDDSFLQAREGRGDTNPPSSSSSCSAPPALSQGAEGGGEKGRVCDVPSSDKVPGFFPWKCMDYGKMALAISAFTIKLQKVPRTNLLLAVCSVMVVFLLFSAAALTYQILLLESRLELTLQWPSAQHAHTRGPSGQWSGRDGQRDSLHHQQDVLKANLQLLEQVHRSLKSLLKCTPSSSSPSPADCPPVQ